MMWIAIFVTFLFGGYLVYGKTLEKNWEIDIYRDQSSWQEDESVLSYFGFRYIQLAQFALLLSFEMLISVVYGYVYGLAYISWLIIGSVFFGGVLSYYGGMYALRNQGYTLNYIIKQKFGAFAHFCTTVLLLGLIAILLGDSYGSFVYIYEKLFDLPPDLLLVHGMLAALLFCFCTARQMTILFAGIGIFAIIALLFLLIESKSQLGLVEYGAHNFDLNELKYAYPLAFFVVALGTVNCLQGLQASLISPMVKNEKVGRKVFFGGAVLQALFLISGNILIAAWNPNIREFYATLFENQTPYLSLQNAVFAAGGKKATLLLFSLAITLFLGFFGSMARLARNLISETKIGKVKFLPAVMTFILVILPVYWLRQRNLKFEYVVVLTQLVGIFSCLTLASFLKSENKKTYHIIWPAMLVLSALTAYVLLVLFKCPLVISNIAGVSVFVLSIGLHILGKNKDVLQAKWQRHKELQAEKQKIKKALDEEKRLQQEKEKELKKQEAERKKLEEEMLKKQKEAEKVKDLEKNQEKNYEKGQRENELKDELAKLKSEREKIEQREKELIDELEKEQSKNLLLLTEKSVAKSEDDFEYLPEPVKTDVFEEKNDDFGVDINSLIEEAEEDTKAAEKFDFDDKIEEPSGFDKFDFETGFNEDFEFESVDKNESVKKEPQSDNQPQQAAQNKKKRRRNRKSKNKNQSTNQDN